jgi:hypothetical protein
VACRRGLISSWRGIAAHSWQPKIEEIARRATLGQLPAIISVPQNESILAAYVDPLQYAKILRFGVKFSGVLLLVASGFVLLCWHVLDRCNGSRLLASTIRSYGRIAFLSSFFIAIAVACFYILLIRGFEGKWYELEAAVRLTADPPYVHRVLFPLAARGVLAIWHTLSVKKAFLLTQLVTLLLLVPAVYYFNSQFVQKSTAALASALLIPLILFSTTYYTFYDYGIILFYTLELIFLLQKRTALYLGALILATLNHENILFLILVSGAMHKPFAPATKYDFRFVALQLLVHFTVRACLFWALPVERASALGNVWINLHYLATAITDPQPLFATVLLFAWFGASLLGLATAPRFLRAATLTLPMLFIATITVGQINEARQFVAFIPVAIALTAWQAQSLVKPEELKQPREAERSELHAQHQPVAQIIHLDRSNVREVGP